MLTNNIPQIDNIFQRVKEIPFPEVQRTFYGAEPRRDKIPCPFHQENSPSFHIYSDGFKCFGCGEAGDNVFFVAKLYELRPFEAARLIAEKFGISFKNVPFSRKDRLRLALAKADQLRESKVEEAFQDWCKNATIIFRTITEAIRVLLQKDGVEIEKDLLPLVHQLPMLEHWADTLAMGTDKEKIELYRDPSVRGWFSCKN